MPTGERRDPYRTFNFQLEIDGVPLGAFSEVSGLTADVAHADYREGTDISPNVRKLPGLLSFGPLKLMRGYTQDRSLWQWHENIVNGQPDRRNVTIVLLNEQRQAVLRWHAENAWVTKIEGPTFKAAGNEVAMESVELVHEGLSIDT